MKNFKDFVKANATKKNNIVGQTTTQMLFPTGFLYLDSINGSIVNSYDDDDKIVKSYANVGIMNGSLNIVIGKSQVGKSTLTTKMAVGILEAWISELLKDRIRINELNKKVDIPAPLLHYIDTEKTMSADYIKEMSGYRNRELKMVLELTAASTDKDVQNALNWHCKYKEDNMQKIKMPMNDVYNEPICIYPPTVMIIDSMTQVNSEDTDETTDEAWAKSTQLTAGARRAQMIGKLNTMLMNAAKKYNIIIFEISHINVSPQMSMVPVAKQYRALKQGETIAGGEKQLYLATSILRIDYLKAVGTAKSSMKNLGDGVTGFITTAQFIKSKSNSRGNSASLVYTSQLRYDPLLSTLYQATENGDIKKVGNNFVLDKYPDIKFNLKNYLDVFSENPILITALYDQLSKKMLTLMDSSERDDKFETNSSFIDSDSDDDFLNSIDLFQEY